MTGAGEDKRRFPRIRDEHGVLVTKLSPGGLPRLSTMRSLGLGGCLFQHKEYIDPGTSVELVLTGGPRLVKATGHVVRERRLPEGTHEIAVEFSDVAPDDAAVLETFFEKPAGPAPR